MFGDNTANFTFQLLMACQLYEYYDKLLEESAYHDPNGNLVPSNRIIAMFHSDSAPSVKTAVHASLADPNGIVRRVFATQSLSMEIHCLKYTLGCAKNT